MLLHFELHVVNFFELIEEPGINSRHFGELLDGVSLANGVTDVAQALGMWRYQALSQNFGFDFFAADAFAGVKRANAFHQRFFERPADGHDFADRFHLRAEVFVSSGEFLELPLGNFYDHVVKRGLETRWSLARDVVGNLVERVTDGQLRRNLRNRESCGFGCER